MNREEAIDILVGVIAANSEEENEALDMAVEALQTPPISQRRMYQAGYRQGKEDALSELEDGTLKVNVQDVSKVKRVLVWGDESGELYYPDGDNDKK